MNRVRLVTWMVMLALVCFAGAANADEIADLKQQMEEMKARLEKIEQQPGMADNDFRVYWKEGLRMDTADGDFKLKIGGRLMVDATWVSADDDLEDDIDVLNGSPVGNGEQEDGIEVRRARLYTEGTIYDDVAFKLQFDFAGGDADLKDAYLELKEFPFGKLRLGHFKEPFSLDELTSSKYITFMERALPNALVPGRNMGIMLHDTAAEDMMTWAVGVFRPVDDFGEGQADGGYAFTGRLTGLAWYDNGGKDLLHLGAAYSWRDDDGGEIRIRQRPEAHLLDRFVDTGDFEYDSQDLLGLEAAWVAGPFSLQGEYIWTDIDGPVESPTFDGWYVQGSYFLTGESRPYKRSSGTFSRVKPNQNLGAGGGLGAWEVAARYSNLDLNDGGINGGEIDDVTLGLNWYLNPNVRMMWNYVYADVEDSGEADIFMWRLQFDF